MFFFSLFSVLDSCVSHGGRELTKGLKKEHKPISNKGQVTERWLNLNRFQLTVASLLKISEFKNEIDSN